MIGRVEVQYRDFRILFMQADYAWALGVARERYAAQPEMQSRVLVRLEESLDAKLPEFLRTHPVAECGFRLVNPDYDPTGFANDLLIWAALDALKKEQSDHASS